MRTIINVNILEVRDNCLYLAGTMPNYDADLENLYISDEKGEERGLTIYRTAALDFHPTGDRGGRTGYVYEVYLPLRADAVYYFFCQNTGGPRRGIHTLSPRYRRYSRLSDVKHSFFCHGNLMIHAYDDGIYIYRNGLFPRRALEGKLRRTVRNQAPPQTLDLRRKAIRMRKRRKPIWLISDRTDAAGDNGEVFFEYLMRSGAANQYDIHFLIDPNSPDYERICSIGPVIPIGTEEHKAAFLASSMLFSSSISSWMLDPLGSERIWYQDLVDHDFVFLQHGVIKDNQSGWLYRLRQNIRLFITSTEAERESILYGLPGDEAGEMPVVDSDETPGTEADETPDHGADERPGTEADETPVVDSDETPQDNASVPSSSPYGYDESVVQLVGLPRYDKLRRAPEDSAEGNTGKKTGGDAEGKQAKKIAFLPNWRPALAPPLIPGTSDRPYSEAFRDSDFFRFYNRLINDPQLLQVMQETGYTGTFYLHPNHRKQWTDFTGNETISVWDGPIPYAQAANENALLVTDYTSDDFDYAYLGKPVIYAQMDREEVLSPQKASQSWFDYERDGFGPICATYEETVSAIIKMLKQDCRQDECYRERADRVFPFRDQSNCQRIYEEILKLTK